MSKQRVRAVIFARYTLSNFKALYGRLRSSSSYSKDYFQINAKAASIVADALGFSGDRVDLSYAWPNGGQVGGYLLFSSDRPHLGWETNNPPAPWRVGQVGSRPEISLEGSPDLQSEADANAVFDAINGQDSKPWLIAVKLAGEDAKLHTRVYFENPPANLADRGLDQLPSDVVAAINALPQSAGLGAIGWEEPKRREPRAPMVVNAVLEALKREPNVLLVGPPGTGKSVALEDLREHYRSIPKAPQFDPDSWPGDWTDGSEVEQETVSDLRSEALVFHPAYSYEQFVAGLFPSSTSKGAIKLEAKAGPLLSLGHWASADPGRKALLILDEFNRGSAAAIFGDTLGLLDGDKRSGAGRAGSYISRPYPNQEMSVAPIYRRDEAEEEHFDSELRLPAGLHIVAAMNSTDRSVAPLDAAMRRRFSVIRVGPDYDLLGKRLLENASNVDRDLPSSQSADDWTPDDVALLAVRVLRTVNDRIEFCLGEDFLLGHALVWNVGIGDTAERLRLLSIAMDTKIVPTLRTTFLDQDDVLAVVLGIKDSTGVTSDREAPEDALGYWRSAPSALASIAPKRLVLREISAFDPTKQLRVLLAVARD
ncbi:AAA family ATPase [Xanthomonas sp. D-99]|uniref:AAA family ATPase n=1 Tax=Xanthomonas sp. D-99 TaxID=2821273 RepID=UPI001AD9BA04|nr:AAA family ATPase [Xanthomonas sp. D-99]MBO9879660.1 AAA family ATPase [Xanthomonas sp. D-99]